DGFERLRAAVVDGPEDLDAFLEHLLVRMLPDGGATDDVALLVVRSLSTPDWFEIVLPADPQQLRVLRARLGGWLERHGVDRETIYEVSLAVTEAAANAVAHAYGLEHAEFSVTACWEGDVLVCGVSDRGRWQTEPRDSNGHGLMLM